MTFTEEEARTKWCPHVRCVVMSDETPPATGNRIVWDRQELDSLNPKECRCIASECMMWVTVGHKFPNNDDNQDPIATHGYCGLTRGTANER